LVVELQRRVEMHEVCCGAGEENGIRLGWWWCCRGE